MKFFSLAFFALVVSSTSFAQSIQISSEFKSGDEVLVCKEKWVFNKFECQEGSGFFKGVIQSISKNSKGEIALSISNRSVVVHSDAFIFRTSGCETRKNKICVGDIFEHSTSGEGSGTFDSDVVGVNSTGVLSYAGGMYYIDLLDWIYGE